MTTTKIFVNLPIKNLKNSIEFFTKLGFTFNQKFTDENATCMVINDNAFAMLLVEKFFKTFTSREICDTKKDIEAIIALSAESREKVDEMMNKVIEAGGKEHLSPQDYGFMYSRSFEDIDGHLWEIFYMDENAMEKKN